MSGVDTKDKSFYHLTCTRTIKKYWKKIFDNFVYMAMLNAYILYFLKTDNPLDRYGFTVNIIEALVGEGTIPVVLLQLDNNLGAGGERGHSLTRLAGVQLQILCSLFYLSKEIKKPLLMFRCHSGVHQACYHILQLF